MIAVVGPAGAAIAPPPPAPDEGTTFDLFAGDQYVDDDNIYRIPSNFGPVASLVSPRATQADRVNTVSTGGTGQWIVGRQDVDLTLRFDDTQFAHNTNLNNTGGDALLVWNWQLGPYFSGVAGVEFNRALASFAETRYLGRDSVNDSEYFGSIKYQVGPRWTIYGGVRDSDIVHGAELAAYNDFRRRSGNVGAEYAIGLANTFGIEYLYTEGIYPSNYTLNNVPFDRNFTEDLYRGKVRYFFTEKLDLDAYAGYLQHNLSADNILPTSIYGNFAGEVWRVTLNWQPTEKTQLAVAGWHELHSYLADASNYFISKGGSISPTWRPTDKITVTATASLEDQDFVANQTVLGLQAEPRFDRIVAEQINIFYVPRARWTLTLFLRNEHRDSNEALYSYVDKLVNVSATFRFF